MTDQIAIIGAGVIGETLLSVLLDAGRSKDTIAITEKLEERAQALHDKYGVSVLDTVAAARWADTILIAVKPQDMAAVLADIGPVVGPGSTIMSLAAGTRIETVQAAVGDDVAVIRVMPNTPVLVGAGMFGISPGAACSDAQLDAAKSLLETCGEVAIVPEDQQDAVTGLSGSGPAYVFLLAESMIAGGVEAGLPAETARQLAVQTVAGAAKLLADGTDTPAELRRRVTSPHGTTAAAISVLEERGFEQAVVAAIGAAKARSAELSAGAGPR